MKTFENVKELTKAVIDKRSPNPNAKLWLLVWETDCVPQVFHSFENAMKNYWEACTEMLEYDWTNEIEWKPCSEADWEPAIDCWDGSLIILPCEFGYIAGVDIEDE